MTFKEFKEEVSKRIVNNNAIVIKADGYGRVLIEDLIPEFFTAAYDVLQEEEKASAKKIKTDEIE